MKSFVFPTGQRNNPLGFFAGPQNDARLPRGFRILRSEKFGEGVISILDDWYHFFHPKVLCLINFKKQQRPTQAMNFQAPFFLE